MIEVEFSPKTLKFLEKTEKIVSKRIFDEVEKLKQNPFPKDVKRVENEFFENEKIFRVRVGDYRILYAVNYTKNRILLVNVDKRSRAYD